MKMRAGAVSGISTKGDELTGRNRHVEWCQTGISHAGLVTVLITSQGSLDTRRERLQMTIDGSLSRRVGDVDRIAETIESDGNARDIAIGNRVNMLPLDIIGLDIETTVKVVRTWLTKISRQ